MQTLVKILPLILLIGVSAAQAGERSAQQVTVQSQGYALLYQTLNKITNLNKLLYVKIESDPVDALATELNEHASAALEDLEAYAETHPGINLEETGLPKVEQARRSNTSLALLKELATTSGASFERLFLLANTNVLNQARHIASALAEVPQDEAGKKLAARLHDTFQADYVQVGKLLDAQYFCEPE